MSNTRTPALCQVAKIVVELLERSGPVLVQIVRTELAAHLDVVLVRRRRHRRDADRIALLADVEHPGALARSSWSMFSVASSATTSRSRSCSGTALCVPPPNGGHQLRCAISFGADLSFTSRMVSPPSRHEP